MEGHVLIKRGSDILSAPSPELINVIGVTFFRVAGACQVRPPRRLETPPTTTKRSPESHIT